MDIIGPDTLVFGVENVPDAQRFVTDFGLVAVEEGADGGVYEALDGTSVTIRHHSDTRLPMPVAAAPNIREIVYGCTDQAAVEEVAAELSRDRAVRAGADGAIHSCDEDGYPVAFRVTTRHAIDAGTPGMTKKLPAGHEARPKAHTLSHVVLFTKDRGKAERFYTERLQFSTVDVLDNLGRFMRPKANARHHALFLSESDKMGLEHFAFHLASADALLKAGWAFAQKGYRSVWGPGRHILGSSYFWYFNTPFGGNMEFDADMDRHDESRNLPLVAQRQPDRLVDRFEHVADWSPRGAMSH